MNAFATRRWLQGAAAWFGAVISMALAFGLFVNIGQMIEGTFPDYPGASFVSEVVGWAGISIFFIALSSVIFALPAVSVARTFGPLSFAKTLALGVVTGPFGACVLGAPIIAESASGFVNFALAGLVCGVVGAIAWWLGYERSRSRRSVAAT